MLKLAWQLKLNLASKRSKLIMVIYNGKVKSRGGSLRVQYRRAKCAPGVRLVWAEFTNHFGSLANVSN